MDEIFSVDKTGDSVDTQVEAQIQDRQGKAAAELRAELRAELGDSLRSLDQLRPPEGLATGVDVFDDFLLWKGLPKGDLSLFLGQPGTGATSLWLKAAGEIHRRGKWAAWVNSEADLMPNALLARELRLDRLLVVKKPRENRQLFWILQELISSSLFEMVGCHLPDVLLKNHQLVKLKKLARLHQVALVLVSHARAAAVNPVFSLIIESGREFFTVRRALHRPTPYTVGGVGVHAQLGADLGPRIQQLLSTDLRAHMRAGLTPTRAFA